MKGAEHRAPDRDLGDGLRQLRLGLGGLATPPEVEDRVMRAWDEAHGATTRPRALIGRGGWAVAAALVLAVAPVYWWWSSIGKPAARATEQTRQTARSWPSDTTLAWLGSDHAALQVVRIRVASAALAQYGYAVSDPDGDGVVDVEMVIGTDGIAQAVRYSAAAVIEPE